MVKTLVTGLSGTNTGTQVLVALLILPNRYKLVGTDMNK